jgi:Flp pilus assembly protein TadG
MKKSRQKCPAARKCLQVLQSVLARSNRKGQALVEFTLVFLLLLVIAWIPADFGLGFMTGQLASNAAREGARIGSASATFNAGTIETETCKRLPAALLADPGAVAGFSSCLPYSNAKVKATLSGGTCAQQVTVEVQGRYNFFFFGLINAIKNSPHPNVANIIRNVSMRWEYQC